MKQSMKQILAGLLAGILAAAPVTVHASLSPDLNGDGSINALDAAIILQYAAEVGAGSQQTMEEFVAALLGQEVPEQTAWQAAYVATIHENPHYADTRYALVFIDGDTIPELIVDDYGDYRMGGVYTYADDAVNQIEGLALRITFDGYVPYEGIYGIDWFYGGNPLEGNTISKLENGTSTVLANFEHNRMYEDSEFYIDETEVTRAEYESRYAQYADRFTEVTYCTYKEIMTTLGSSASELQ